MTDGPKFEFRFAGSEQWFPSPYRTEEAVAYHAMRLHGGRIGKGVRKVGKWWRPRARVRAANSVQVRLIAHSIEVATTTAPQERA